MRGRPAAVLLAALFLAGCYYPRTSRREGRQIDAGMVSEIRPGITTRDALIERFGAPFAILSKGEDPAVSAPVFELFPGPPGGDSRRVYCYRHLWLRTVYLAFPPLFTKSVIPKSDQLWVEVDEAMGVVDDYAFMKSGDRLKFGRPDPAAER